MNIGALRERIAFESSRATRDEMGGSTMTWACEGNVWASVAAVTGREASISAQIEAVTSMKVVARYREDVRATWRVRWRTRVLSIEAVLPNPVADEMTLLCSEGLNQSDLST